MTMPNAKATRRSLLLFLYFLKDYALSKCLTILLKLDLARHLTTVLSRKVHLSCFLVFEDD
jgi:hypothetical protein